MEKYSERLWEKHSATPKGKLYCYLVAANDAAYTNQYKNFTLDKEYTVLTAYINNRLEEIFGKSGAYWTLEYKGYSELLEKGRAAQDDIEKGYYTQSVVEFIETAVKSYLPKGTPREEKKEIQLPPIKKNTIVAEKVTGKQLVNAKKLEDSEKVVIENEEVEFKNSNKSVL